MPLSKPVKERVTELNARYKHHSATAVLEHALQDAQVGKTAMVSSFGAESVVLLHLVSVIDRTTPILFIDTQMLFSETLTYQHELTERLNLKDIRIIKATNEAVNFEDPDGTLHQFNTDACCNLRKTVPLQNALKNFDAWITGRKRFQANSRSNIDFFENENDIRIKINSLAHWTGDDLQTYMNGNRLPRHPLVAKGYPSIGCEPCTSLVKEGEDPRAGRWRNSNKQECGIHFVNGKAVRKTATA